MEMVEIVSLRYFRFSEPGVAPKPRTFIVWRDDEGQVHTIIVEEFIESEEAALEAIKSYG